MRRFELAALAAVVTMAALPASAAVTFDFEFNDGSGGFVATLPYVPIYNAPAPPGTTTDCSTSHFTCVGVEFLPDTSSLEDSGLDTFDAIGLDFYVTDPTPPFSTMYFAFTNGAFGQNGTFTSLINPSVTLTISGSPDIIQPVPPPPVDPGPIPEPATWAMMLAGFGLVGAAMRSGRLGRYVEDNA